MDILYNREINQIKINETLLKTKPKFITFRILDDNENTFDANDIKSKYQGRGMY